jgi:hypothetical protein
MRRDGGSKPQFPIFRKRNFWAWSTDNPNQIESPQQISIYAHAIWQRKSPMSEAIVREIEQILPVGRISDAQCAIAESGLRSVILFLGLNLVLRWHAGMAGLAGGPTPSRMTQLRHRPRQSGALVSPYRLKGLSGRGTGERHSGRAAISSCAGGGRCWLQPTYGRGRGRHP